MSVKNEHPQLAAKILETTGASAIRCEDHVQSLWSGYGQITRICLAYAQAVEDAAASVVVKLITPPAIADHPRGWNTDASTQRKITSYNVETKWYQRYSQESRRACAMPHHFASGRSEQSQWIILEDLDRLFPGRRTHLSIEQCVPCLQWLARFHAQHLHQPPEGLWPVGTYWHLDTRADEFDAMPSSALKTAAVELDRQLNTARYQTLVHGDAKVANFCFDYTCENVAMVDFQYVGRGCGIKDVAYFLGSALSDAQCETFAETLLEEYFSHMKRHVSAADFPALEEEWRRLYCTAWADFHRFLAGWMPEHQKINKYTLAMTELALAQLAR